MKNVWMNGLAGLGDDMIVNTPFMTTGNVWFVHYGTGTDAVSPQGLSQEYPLKTLSQAVTNAAHDDTIVLLDGHDETIGSKITISKRLCIIGAGTSAGIPTAKLTNAQGADSIFQFSTTDIQIRNVYFPVNSISNSAYRVNFSGANWTRFYNCYVECNGLDTNFVFGVNSSTSYVRVQNCTFVSTATSAALRPYAALGGSTIVSWDVFDCTFDGGSVGFAGSVEGAAFFVGTACSQLNVQNLTLLRGADFYVPTAATGTIVGVTATGSSRVVW